VLETIRSRRCGGLRFGKAFTTESQGHRENETIEKSKSINAEEYQLCNKSGRDQACRFA
jgi:hypothetical protein